MTKILSLLLKEHQFSRCVIHNCIFFYFLDDIFQHQNEAVETRVVNTLGIAIPEYFMDSTPNDDDPQYCRSAFYTFASRCDLISLEQT